LRLQSINSRWIPSRQSGLCGRVSNKVRRSVIDESFVRPRGKTVGRVRFELTIPMDSHPAVEPCTCRVVKTMLDEVWPENRSEYSNERSGRDLNPRDLAIVCHGLLTDSRAIASSVSCEIKTRTDEESAGGVRALPLSYGAPSQTSGAGEIRTHNLGSIIPWTPTSSRSVYERFLCFELNENPTKWLSRTRPSAIDALCGASTFDWRLPLSHRCERRFPPFTSVVVQVVGELSSTALARRTLARMTSGSAFQR
jgi:hypothetical protein